ncbi:MAG TPA: MFS transporter, partial [Anaerolineaceae bacterium]|nr:MFS transporter [Anaerolineaceae bacterium]
MILANIAGQMYLPLLPLYLKDLNAGVMEVGLFFTLSQIVPLALQILGGWVSDSLGRLRSIALGSVAGVLSYVGLILSPSWEWILLAEGFGAMTRALVGPSFGAFIAEQSEEENRARVFGIVETIYGVVGVVGPLLGGWLAQTFGFKFMLLWAGVFYTIATIIRIFMARIAAQGKESSPQKLTLISLRTNLGAMFGLMFAGGLLTWILITDGVRDISFSMSFNLIPLYLEEFGGLNAMNLGTLMAMSAVAGMLVNIPAGWLADKKGERVVIAGGFFLIFGGILSFMQANNFGGYAFAWILFGLGSGMLGPAYSSLMSKAIPEKIRGTAFGLLNTSLGLFSLPAPAIGAYLWKTYNPQSPFTITAVVCLISIIPVWLKFRIPAKVSDSTEPTN